MTRLDLECNKLTLVPNVKPSTLPVAKPRYFLPQLSLRHHDIDRPPPPARLVLGPQLRTGLGPNARDILAFSTIRSHAHICRREKKGSANCLCSVVSPMV
jgi:hypothetical protein